MASSDLKLELVFDSKGLADAIAQYSASIHASLADSLAQQISDGFGFKSPKPPVGILNYRRANVLLVRSAFAPRVVEIDEGATEISFETQDGVATYRPTGTFVQPPVGYRSRTRLMEVWSVSGEADERVRRRALAQVAPNRPENVRAIKLQKA